MEGDPILHQPNHKTGNWDAYDPGTNSWGTTGRSFNRAGIAVRPTTFVKYDPYGGRKSRRNIRRRGYSKKHKRVHHTRRKHTRRHRHRHR